MIKGLPISPTLSRFHHLPILGTKPLAYGSLGHIPDPNYSINIYNFNLSFKKKFENKHVVKQLF
jgi:hypothetical protein